MATVWRLTRTEYARDLSGEGSSIAGGRWNSPGQLMLYTSSHLSLSVLEVFVNIAPVQRDNLPDLMAVRITVPDDAGTTTVSHERFHELIRSTAPLAACRAFGDQWLIEGATLILRAPSVVVPEELNLMLNPMHPAMHKVTIEAGRHFNLDPRLVEPKL